MTFIDEKQSVSCFKVQNYEMYKYENRCGCLFSMFAHFLWLKNNGKMKHEKWWFFFFFHSGRLFMWVKICGMWLCTYVCESRWVLNSSWGSLCCSCSSQVNSDFNYFLVFVFLYCWQRKVYTFVLSCLFTMLFLNLPFNFVRYGYVYW